MTEYRFIAGYENSYRVGSDRTVTVKEISVSSFEAPYRIQKVIDLLTYREGDRKRMRRI